MTETRNNQTMAEVAGQTAAQPSNTESASKPPVQEVSGYERSNGTKVGDYKRAVPGTKRENEGEQQQEPGEPATKKQVYTIDDLLFRDLEELKSRISKSQVEADPESKPLVERDEAEAKMGQEAPGQIPNAAQQPEPRNVGDFVLACQMYRASSKSDVIDSIVNHARAGRYNEGGEFGMKALVPHLQLAGAFELAGEVMRGAYRFPAPPDVAEGQAQ